MKFSKIFPIRLKDLLIFGLGAGFLLAGLILFWITTFKVPDPSSFSERKTVQSTKIYDKTGQVLLYDLGGDVIRTAVDLGNISRNVKNATIAIEDAEFYEHRGIKPTAIVRAVLSNILIILHLQDGYTQGGSTITQQVVKNSILTKEKLISRKLKEWVLALRLEQLITKDEILEIYLNETPYGGRLYGIEEAAQAYFGKNAASVTLAEAAYLAALPQAPTYYSPYGSHRDKLEERKNLVLAKMVEYQFITEEERANALAETITFLPRADSSIKAPHFVFYVQEYLEEKYGKEFLERGGLKVTTTLDYALEAVAEDIVKRYALENKEKFDAENAALVALDPKTGGILVMAGSRDYFDPEIDGAFNIAVANRQPGSAFKPFVYATAFLKGYTPETVVFDLETEFSTLCSPNGTPLSAGADPEKTCYSPQNYDEIFRGPVTLRNALAQSLNIPSVKTLYLAGIADSLETSRDMGISTLTNPGQYGLTLVLGGGEVTPLDITSAYGVFANDGIRAKPNPILKIETTGGEIIEETRPETLQAIPSQIARQVSDILADNDARSPAFGERSYLYFPGRDVAVKTGTTNDYRDAWIIGYTPSIAVGAWAGNNDNRPMQKRVAGFIVAPLWNAFMQEALKVLPQENFPRPDQDPEYATLKPVLRGIWQGNAVYRVDKRTETPATESTPPEFIEERIQADVHSILHWVTRDAPRGEIPVDPTQDPQYERWEYAIREWVSKNTVGNVVVPQTTIPVSSTPSGNQSNSPLTLSLFGIDSNTLYNVSSKRTLTIEGGGPNPLSKVEVYLNGRLVGTDSTNPFSIDFVPATLEGVQNKNTLSVVGQDTAGNRKEIVLEVFLNLGN